MESQLFLLKASSFAHSFFTLSSIFSVVLISFGRHSGIVDAGAFLTFFSFFLFKRCVLIDIHRHIQKDLIEVPYLAQDSFTRDSIKHIVNKIFRNKVKLHPEKSKFIEQTRLDILKNVEPFIQENEPMVIQDMYNRKIQYIAGNIILGSILMSKYQMKWFPSVLMFWVITTFPF
jgi:hypothetical protein